MKSNIQSKKFYAEAEGMQKGWGKYLRWIDELKDKVHAGKSIPLKDAQWVLYGEGYPSYYWKKFGEYCGKIKIHRKLLPWEAWKGIFDKWMEEER